MKKRIITKAVKPNILLEIIIVILLFFFNFNNLTFTSEVEKKEIAEVVGVQDYTVFVPQRTATEKSSFDANAKTIDITFKISKDDYNKLGLDYQTKKEFSEGDKAIKQEKRSFYECTYRVNQKDANYVSATNIKSRNNELIVNFLYIAAIVVLIIIALKVKKHFSE